MSGRLAALDGLRTLSVTGVLVTGFAFLLPFGWIGVLVFYVLSGFLITDILLGERAQARGAGDYFRRFYFRRTLRIFPLYFAYLLALELVYRATGVHAGWPDVRPFALGYAVNVGMILGAVDTGAGYGHLWTLAVEEQFYLLWPLFVWWLPRSWLRRAVVLLIAAGPLVRIASAEWFGMNKGQIYVSSFTHLDGFAAGAALALFDFGRVRNALQWATTAGALTLGLGLIVTLTTGAALRTLGYREGLLDGSTYVWGYSVLNLTAALVILAAVRGDLPALGHPVLAYLGRISYGIYLFQRPVVGLYLAQLEPALSARVPFRPLATVLGIGLCFGAAVMIAAASYHAFEAPLLRWRDRKVPARRAPLAAEPARR